MPRRHLAPCATPGCPQLTPQSHCPTHLGQHRRTQARQRRAAGDEAMSIYSTARWRRTRKRHLDRNPTCTDCGAEATEVDHVIPRAQLLEQGVTDPDADHWLQALCEPCHSSKTATTDGGFGRPALDIDER